MTTPFDGLGVWSFWFDGVGTPLTAADCQAYKAVGVYWICVKVSDGTQTWGGTPAAQMDLVRQAGMRAIPWGFLYGNLSIPAQLAALQSAGPGPYIMDIEEAVAVGQLAPVAHESAVATWGDPQNFPGQPSIGQLADVGLAAVMPEAYSGAWLLTPAEAIARAVGDYQALHLTNLPPLLPINDSAEMLAFAQAAKAAGCSGVSAWRHGANGITPSALAGVSAVFEAQPPAPSPTYSLAPPTAVSQLSSALDPWDDCGEACVASVVTDAGLPVSVFQVASWATANGSASTNGETTAAQLVAELQHFGVAAAVVALPLSESIPQALSRKHEVMVLVSSNSDGVPTPGTGIGHWLLAYAVGPSGYSVMNPLGSPPGQLVNYPLATLQACDMVQAVEVERVLPKDGGQPLGLPSGTYTVPQGSTLTVP